MVKDYSINEHAGIEAMELFIIESLLNFEIVEIPDFGYLEAVSVGERGIVLFKPVDKRELTLQSDLSVNKKEDANGLYTFISAPLKEEKTVNLSKIGVFRPIKKEDGGIYVSFVLSPYLRKALNKGKEAEEAESIETVKNENIELENKVLTSYQSRNAQANDQYVFQEGNYEKGRLIKKGSVLLFTVCVIVIAIVIMSTIHSRNIMKEEAEIEGALSNESGSLPALAEQHYGNTAFWIYIYETNKDKLSSPINISKALFSTLVIPDLKSEYDVDVTDSMEIQRANIWADMVLKEKLNEK